MAQLSLDSFLAQSAARLARGPVAMIFVEDDVEIASTVNHHLELGRTYLEMDRHADARRELEQAVALPATSNPRDPHYQDEARELLKKLPKRE